MWAHGGSEVPSSLQGDASAAPRCELTVPDPAERLDHGWFWEPGCSWLDSSEMKIPYTSGCRVSLARRCWQKQVAASRVAMEGGLGEFRGTGTWVPHKGGMLSGFK